MMHEQMNNLIRKIQGNIMSNPIKKVTVVNVPKNPSDKKDEKTVQSKGSCGRCNRRKK